MAGVLVCSAAKSFVGCAAGFFCQLVTALKGRRAPIRLRHLPPLRRGRKSWRPAIWNPSSACSTRGNIGRIADVCSVSCPKGEPHGCGELQGGWQPEGGNDSHSAKSELPFQAIKWELFGMRTHYCGLVDEALIDREVTLCG